MINKKNLEIQGIIRNSHGQPFTFEELKEVFSSFIYWLEEKNLTFAGDLTFLEEVRTITTATTRQGVYNNLEVIWAFLPEKAQVLLEQKPNFVVRPDYTGAIPPFQLIETEDYSGYYYEEVLDSLNNEQAQDLSEWMNGQTMGLHQNADSLQTIIYAWDYDRWLQGLPVID